MGAAAPIAVSETRNAPWGAHPNNPADTAVLYLPDVEPGEEINWLSMLVKPPIAPAKPRLIFLLNAVKGDNNLRHNVMRDSGEHCLHLEETHIV